MTDFLVEMAIKVPADISAHELELKRRAEALYVKQCAAEGSVVRLWRPKGRGDALKNIGIWSAPSRHALNTVLGNLPMFEWISLTVRELEPHPNDPQDGTTDDR